MCCVGQNPLSAVADNLTKHCETTQDIRLAQKAQQRFLSLLLCSPFACANGSDKHSKIRNAMIASMTTHKREKGKR
jgi:hypothetical protein